MKQTYMIWEAEFPLNLCDEIVEKSLSEGALGKGTIFYEEWETSQDRRNSNVKFLKDPTLKQEMLKYAFLANKEFEVEISYLPNVQFTEYREGCFYDTHHDVDWFSPLQRQRKLSITIQLTDSNLYEGGDFNFRSGIQPDPQVLRKKGTILVFPSYIEHSVSKVTKGIRHSLVGWVEGPKWK